MGYISDIRKRVGHDPVMLCGASVIVENGKGEILLQRRRDDGTWAYAGGAVELYERVEDAARRELYEETGVRAGEMTLLGVFSGAEWRHVYPNGDQASIIDIVFVCRDYTGEVRMEEDEVTDIGFFDIEHLPQPQSDCMKPVIPAYLAARRKQA